MEENNTQDLSVSNKTMIIDQFAPVVSDSEPKLVEMESSVCTDMLEGL